MICIRIEYLLISLSTIFFIIDVYLIYKLLVLHYYNNQEYVDETRPINV